MTRRALIFLIAIWAFSPALSARTYQVIGTTFPFISDFNNGELSGLGIDIAREIAARTGLDIEINLYPWKRALFMMKHGKADMLIGPYKSKERLDYMIFSASPFYRDELFFFKRADDDFTWHGDFSELRQQSIATVRGWAYSDKFRQARPMLEIADIPSTQIAVRMLERGRVRLFASHQRETEKVLGQLELDQQITPLYPSISHKDGFFAYSRQTDTDELRRLFDAELQRIIQDGRLDKFKSKYSYFNNKR